MKDLIKVSGIVVVSMGLFFSCGSFAGHAERKEKENAVQVNHVAERDKKEAAETVDINTADVEALRTLKGVGAHKAEAIVDYRKNNGSFASVEDLSKVKGIGSKAAERIIKKNEGKITVSP